MAAARFQDISMQRPRHILWLVSAFVLLGLTACSPLAAGSTATPAVERATSSQNAPTAPSPATPATAAVPPQTTPTPAVYGPDQTRFPSGYNPLTGLPAADPALLKVPAVLVSISHFPATGRPQAGLSFAPFVYEFSITGGETRFLAAFYGQWPAPELAVTGDCAIRQGAFTQTGTLLYGRAWLDADRNGRLDVGEEGIPGLCVALLDSSGAQIRLTTTDTNGYYGFNVDPGASYAVKFLQPSYLDFTAPHVGDDSADSDADQSTGATSLVEASTSPLRLDAGLYPNVGYESPTPDPKLEPQPVVGPVRSGRLLYAHIAAFYQDSCLIYAFADPIVLAQLPHCAFVAHETAGGGEMLPIARMQAVAEENMRRTTNHPFNYASNAFSASPPAGGSMASQLDVFYGNLDQSGWTYDPLYQAYLRYVDTADPKARGVLHADVDRLTGRQLHFENVIIVMADTDVVSATNLDIRLEEGNTGPAYLFRDGRIYSIQWSTRAGSYERTTGLRRPIQFLQPDGSPALLKPGHTWVILVTPFSQLKTLGPGTYQIVYAPPEGEAQ